MENLKLVKTDRQWERKEEASYPQETDSGVKYPEVS